MRLFRKFISVFLASSMLLTAFAFTVTAADSVEFMVDYGQYGSRTVYYYKNGVHCFDEDIVYGTVHDPAYNVTRTSWYYVNNGEINYVFTGLAHNAWGWWFVDEGEVNFQMTGLWYQYGYYWYIRNGRIDWDYNGLVYLYGYWWYVTGGKIDFSAHRMVDQFGERWYVKDGYVHFDFSGSVTTNANGLEVISKGRVDRDYTGIYTTDDYRTLYCITNGIQDKSVTGYRPFNGTQVYFYEGKSA